MSNKLKVLIVDDSAIVRGLLEKSFGKSEFFEIAASVSNGRKAVDYCRENSVDVVVTDYDMPEMDGIEETKILKRELGIPVCILSEDSSKKHEALEAGAIYFGTKPALSSYTPQTFSDVIDDLHALLERKGVVPHKDDARHERQKSDSSSKSFEGSLSDFKVLCIGASTGGPNAVRDVLSGLGPNFPLPVLYVQHIDVGADQKMVNWFNSVCPNIPMHLVSGGEEARPGHAYMAPAEKHLEIDYVKKNGNPVLKLSDEPPERFLRPAVNKLFRSAAHLYKKECLAVLLTGMGRDGAEGCLEIVNEGGFTIVEDRSTCAVFGMPAAAIELNAARMVMPRDSIPRTILSFVR